MDESIRKKNIVERDGPNKDAMIQERWFNPLEVFGR